MVESNELIRAASAGDVGLVNRLLNDGADIDAVGIHGTALHAAIAAERFWCVATLVKRGANPEATSYGLTALAFAVDAAIDRSNQCNVPHVPTDVIDVLIAAGADLKPGLKIANDYKCDKLVTRIGAAIRTVE